MTTSTPTGFTPDEVQGVVDQLVQTTVRRPYDSLGVRRTDITFSDLQSAAANVLILYPASPFYVVRLASGRLMELVLGMETDLLGLLTSLHVLRKRTLPVRDLSALQDAKVALGALGTAVGNRTSQTNVSTIPAYVRFNASVSRFLSQVGGNIKDPKLGIVPTPQEARGNIPGQLQAVETDLVELVRRAGLIKGAVADYGSLDLPDLVASSVISNAEKLLSSRYASLAAMGETDRLSVIRQTVLEMLSSQSVVGGLGVFKPPTGVTTLTGQGAAFADATRPANGAVLSSDKLGPYVLYAGHDESTSTNILYLYLDGAPAYPAVPSSKLYIPASRYAKVEGLNPGPFVISAGVNDNFQLLINGTTLVSISLPIGGAITALAVEAALTAALTPHGFMAKGFFSPLMFDGQVVVGAGNVVSMAFGNFPPGSINPGDEVDFYFGPNATTTRTVVSVNIVAGATVSFIVGGAALTVNTTDRIQYGSAQRRIRILPVNIPASLTAQDFLQVKQPTAVERNAGITLGFYGEIAGSTALTDAKIISDYINGNTQLLTSGLRFVSSIGPLLVRTETSNVLTFVVYFAQAQATWNAGTFVSLVIPQKLTDTRIIVGTSVVLRGGSNPDAVGTILAISTDGLTYTLGFGSPVSAVSVSSLVEFMPAFPFVSKGMVLIVSSGVNAGRYYVDVPSSTIPGQFKARTAAPLPRDGFNQAVFMSGDIGQEGFTLLSKDKTLASSVGVFDQNSTFFNAPSPPAVHTTTNYFKLPSLPAALTEGDFLDEHITNIEVADVAASITRIDSDGVLQLDQALAYNLALTFGSTALPYGVLRVAIVNNFNAYAAALIVWLTHFPVATSTYFNNLNALVNPLLKNTSPTDSDVGTAENAIRQIYKYITIAGANAVGSDPTLTLESIIKSYTAQVVPEIDVLITTYTQKGADRAMDLFLEPQFSTFFGLSQAQSSYAGAFQAAAQAVALNDLTVLKTNRAITSKSQLTGVAQSPDYETDSSDLDPTAQVDPPADIDRTA